MANVYMHMHVNIKDILKSALQKFRKTQVEIKIFKPFKIPEDPAPIPFTFAIQSNKFEGYILRQDKARVLSKHGDSKLLSVPANWVSSLPDSLKPFLIQINNGLGLLYFSEKNELLKGVN